MDSDRRARRAAEAVAAGIAAVAVEAAATAVEAAIAATAEATAGVKRTAQQVFFPQEKARRWFEIHPPGHFFARQGWIETKAPCNQSVGRE